MRDLMNTNLIPIYNDVSTLSSERKGSYVWKTIHKQQNPTRNQSLSKLRVYISVDSVILANMAP